MHDAQEVRDRLQALEEDAKSLSERLAKLEAAFGEAVSAKEATGETENAAE